MSHTLKDTREASPRDAPAASDQPPEPVDAILSLDDVGVTIGDNVILEDVSLSLRRGEILTVIGPNGGGKTTLVRVLLGLQPPSKGRLTRRPGLETGYVPQRFDRDLAMPLTVGDFLAMGHAGARTLNDIENALDDCGARHVLSRQVSRLSGGELQRVLLARAILRQPDLLVLDEPVRGVDHMGEADLYRLIGRLRNERGFSVVLISHDLHVVMAASDRVICLNRHICCSGKPTTVAQHPEYTRLFGPEAAQAFAVYEHHHDHAHALSGEPLDSSDACSHHTSQTSEGGAIGNSPQPPIDLPPRSQS